MRVRYAVHAVRDTSAAPAGHACHAPPAVAWWDRQTHATVVLRARAPRKEGCACGARRTTSPRAEGCAFRARRGTRPRRSRTSACRVLLVRSPLMEICATCAWRASSPPTPVPRCASRAPLVPRRTPLAPSVCCVHRASAPWKEASVSSASRDLRRAREDCARRAPSDMATRRRSQASARRARRTTAPSRAEYACAAPLATTQSPEDRAGRAARDGVRQCPERRAPRAPLVHRRSLADLASSALLVPTRHREGTALTARTGLAASRRLEIASRASSDRRRSPEAAARIYVRTAKLGARHSGCAWCARRTR